MNEHDERRIQSFLISKGHSKEVSEFKNAQRALLDKNSPESRINFKKTVDQIKRIASAELEMSNKKGLINDEFQIIDRNIKEQDSARKAYIGEYGEVPAGFSVGEAYRLRMAEHAFQEDPSAGNASKVILAKGRGDLEKRNQEQRRAEHIGMEQRMRTGFEKEIHSSEESQKAHEAKLEVDRKDFEAIQEEKLAAGNDRRLMHTYDKTMDKTPMEKQVESEKLESMEFRNEFDEKEGY